MIEIVLARLLNYDANQYTNNIIIPTLFIKSVGDIAIASVRSSVCPYVRPSVRPSVTLSPPKLLDAIISKLVCELLT